MLPDDGVDLTTLQAGGSANSVDVSFITAEIKKHLED